MPEQEELHEKHTIGDMARSVRDRAGLSVDRFSHLAGVPIDFINALERDEYDRLPARPYVLGMLKKYGELCDAPYDEFVSLWMRTGSIRSSGKTDTLPRNRFAKPRSRAWDKLDFHPAIWLVIAVGLYVLVQIGYLAMPVRVRFSQPADVVHDSTAVLAGTFRGYVRNAWLNSDLMTVKQNAFSQSVYLNPGVNTFEVKASNFFRVQTTAKKIIVYENPAQPSQPQNQRLHTPMPTASIEPIVPTSTRGM